MKRQYNLLLHPAFLVSLFLLLLNDISLKYEFHNSITGKLSDFCGLFAFVIFWLALIPGRKKSVIISIALFFTWWKSPLSTPFIQGWNETMPFSIARVIDYGDLFALVVLPIALKISQNHFDPKIRYRRLFIPLVGTIALFSFCFTTPPRYAAYYYPPNEIRFYGTFKTHSTEEEILQKLTARNVPYQKDSIGYYELPHYYENSNYVLRIGDPANDSVKWLPLGNTKDSVLHVRRKEDPFYIIPQYNLDGNIINNVKITITPRKENENIVVVRTFQWNSREEFSGKIKRQYKAHFRELFK